MSSLRRFALVAAIIGALLIGDTGKAQGQGVSR
jgi:hypothetical protein